MGGKRRSDPDEVGTGSATKRRRVSAPGQFHPQASCRAFTLTELMVAVAVLVVVILAAAKIFGTASKVTGLGQATRDVMQEAAAVERQIRSDFARLSNDGFFAIHCVVVPNDVNWPLLLNPNLPRKAELRADQLVFFTTGIESTQVFADSPGSAHKQQGVATRLYYGHAFQLPNAEVLTSADPAVTFSGGDPILPWSLDPSPPSLAMSDAFSGTSLGMIDGSQPPATSWLLTRQPVLLADDGGGLDSYLTFGSGGNSTDLIGDLTIRNGRRDIAASQLNDIRNIVTNYGTAPWDGPSGQQARMMSAVMYPRAERVVPSMFRVDHALTSHVLATACSSFTVDWTYTDGVGDAVNANRDFYRGLVVNPAAEQPWFGFDPDGLRGVGTFHDYASSLGSLRPQTIGHAGTDDRAVEAFDPPGGPTDPEGYWAIFGYNQDEPLDPATGAPWVPATNVVYTPLPTAIRITMVLHDARGKLENGRVVQFVIDLPKRASS